MVNAVRCQFGAYFLLYILCCVRVCASGASSGRCRVARRPRGAQARTAAAGRAPQLRVHDACAAATRSVCEPQCDKTQYSLLVSASFVSVSELQSRVLLALQSATGVLYEHSPHRFPVAFFSV